MVTAFAVFGDSERDWFSGKEIGRFEVSIPYQKIRDEYDEFHVGYDDSQSHLNLRFRQTVGDAPYNQTLIFAPQGFLPAHKLIYRIRNLGTSTIRMLVRLGNYSEEYACTSKYWVWSCQPSQSIPADGQWHDMECVYDRERWKHDGAPSKDIVGPINRVDFVLLENKPGELVNMEISRIYTQEDIECTPVPQNPIELPDILRAGEKFDFAGAVLKFRGRVPMENRCRLVLRSAEEIPGAIPVECALNNVTRTQEDWRIPAQTPQLTRYIFDGKYIVSLYCGEEILDLGTVVVENGVKTRGLSRFHVQEWKGAPTLFHEGQVLPMVKKCTFTHGGDWQGPKLFSKAGVDLFGFDGTATDNATMLHCACVNPAEGIYDFQEMDERFMAYLEVNPDAYLMPRLVLDAPLWWSEEHPEAQAVVESPDGRRHVIKYYNGRPAPTWASKAWQEYTQESLRRLVEHISRAPYASRVFGLFLCSGITQEWFQWGDAVGVCGDYSPISQESFRQWLKAKYQTDQSLQKAWKNPEVTLASAEIPTYAERTARPTLHQDLRDMENSADLRCIDFFKWNGEMVADVIAGLARTVKEASENRMITGAFYGYLLEICGSDRLVNSGHLGFGKLVRCPYLDFMASPTGYGFRQSGGKGISYAMSPAASLKLHNKFWWVEMDIRTSWTNAPLGYAGKPATFAEDLLQQDKEAAHSICSGFGQWWLDVGYIRYDNDEFMAHVGKLVSVMKECISDYDRTSQAQIAMILQEESYSHGRVPSAVMVDDTTYQLPCLERLGATVEYYSASDIAKLPERIRLIILGTAVENTPALSAALKRLRSEGRVILSFHAPGVVPSSETQSQEESMAEISGIPLKMVPRVEDGVAHKIGDGRIFSADEEGQEMKMTFWGPRKSAMSPVPTIREDVLADQISIIARYANGDGAGAVHYAPDHTDVLMALPYVDCEFYLKLVDMAGVHRYVDTQDQVWATTDLVGICVKNAGERIVHLQRPSIIVRDLFTGEEFRTDANGDALIPFAEGATRLLKR